jgi:hypothetical protein
MSDDQRSTPRRIDGERERLRDVFDEEKRIPRRDNAHPATTETDGGSSADSPVGVGAADGGDGLGAANESAELPPDDIATPLADSSAEQSLGAAGRLVGSVIDKGMDVGGAVMEAAKDLAEDTVAAGTKIVEVAAGAGGNVWETAVGGGSSDEDDDGGGGGETSDDVDHISGMPGIPQAMHAPDDAPDLAFVPEDPHPTELSGLIELDVESLDNIDELEA